MSTLTAAPTITYRLPYDAETRDHNCLVTIEGEPEQSIGYAPTFHEAEKKCRQYIDDLLASDLFRTASALDGGSPDAIATEYAAALPKPCATCGSDGSPCVDCNPAPADHNLITPDPAECPDISAPQPLNDLPRCEQRAVAPSLALWGPDTPKCTDCGTRHDPILDCPGGRETSDLFFDRLCNQASDLVTRLVLEKSRLAHGPIVCNDHIARETRIWRLNRIIDRAARRLGRRFIAQMQLGSTIDVSRVTDVPFVVPAPEPVPAWLTAAPVTQCANCDGLHHIQRCPEVWRALTG